jgi:hypothetical protein
LINDQAEDESQIYDRWRLQAPLSKENESLKYRELNKKPENNKRIFTT